MRSRLTADEREAAVKIGALKMTHDLAWLLTSRRR
jgi:hypothetical protein